MTRTRRTFLTALVGGAAALLSVRRPAGATGTVAGISAFEEAHNAIVAAIEATGHEATDEFVADVADLLDQCQIAKHAHITPSVAANLVLEEYADRSMFV